MSYKTARQKVLRRANFKCHYCGERATTVDHLTPRAHGGCDSAENLVPACSTCNTERYVISYTLFKRYVELCGRPHKNWGRSHNRYKIRSMKRIYESVSPVKFYNIVKQKWPHEYRGLLRRFINYERTQSNFYVTLIENWNRGI